MFSILFISLLLEALPFILIGSIISALLEVAIPQNTLLKIIPKNKFIAMLAAPFLGLLFPVCECVIVVIVRRLLKKGIPVHVAIPYMLSGTIINFVVMASTYFAFQNNWKIVFFRCIGGYLVSVAIAYLLFLFSKDKPIFIQSETANSNIHSECNHDDHVSHDNNCCSHHHHHSLHSNSWKEKASNFFETLQNDFFYVSKFLILGSMIAAFLNSSVSRDFLVSLGSHGFLGNITMIMLAYVLSVCSEADAFIAASFTAFSTPSKLAFLIFGPMLDLKLTFMYLALFNKKYAFLLMGLIFIGVMLFVSILGVWL